MPTFAYTARTLSGDLKSATMDANSREDVVAQLRRQKLIVVKVDEVGHQVEPGHHLRHGVFDLQACVHLEEVEVPVLVHHALDRAGVHVAGRLRVTGLPVPDHELVTRPAGRGART